MAENAKALDLGALEQLLAQLNSKIPTKVSALTNDAKYQTQDQVTSAINSRIVATYKPGGSVAFVALPTPSVENLGLVVNVTDAFITTSDFLDGAGQTYPAGTNVAIVESGGTYKYDALSGFVDLSGYQQKENGKGLSDNNYTTEEKDKLRDIAANASKVEASETSGCIKVNGTNVTVVEFASDEEVTQMLSRVFGA